MCQGNGFGYSKSTMGAWRRGAPFVLISRKNTTVIMVVTYGGAYFGMDWCLVSCASMASDGSSELP